MDPDEETLALSSLIHMVGIPARSLQERSLTAIVTCTTIDFSPWRAETLVIALDEGQVCGRPTGYGTIFIWRATAPSPRPHSSGGAQS